MNKQAILQYIDKKFQKKEPVKFNIGDTVRVHVKIIEGTTARIQVFEGVVISFSGQGGARCFIVRKVSFGVGVERTFPLNSPALDKITVVRTGHVRRAKLYYLRDRSGKAARLSEKDQQESNAPGAAGAASSPAPSPARESTASDAGASSLSPTKPELAGAKEK